MSLSLTKKLDQSYCYNASRLMTTNSFLLAEATAAHILMKDNLLLSFIDIVYDRKWRILGFCNKIVTQGRSMTQLRKS